MTQRSGFDPVAFKETTHQQWQNAAAAWHRWGPTLYAWLNPVTVRMLNLAHLGPGARVIDVAAGTGEPALSAAERVGSSGYVLATDLSSNILRFAAHEAQTRGLSEAVFQTRVLDGENLDLAEATFDAALSRLGLIYFPDRVRGLAEMWRVLVPGGRAVVAGFTVPERNPFFSIPIGIIRRRMHLPPPEPGQPGPFSLGDPSVMQEAYRRAGFRAIETHIVSAALRLPSASVCAQFERESFGALQQMLSGVSVDEQMAAWEEIEEGLRRFDGSGGFETPTELIVGVGIR
jgi:ubiquinone/menaquinone biosynthesis C-methylase UbiE